MTSLNITKSVIVEVIAISGIIFERSFEIAAEVTKVEVDVPNIIKDIITSNAIAEAVTILLNTRLI